MEKDLLYFFYINFFDKSKHYNISMKIKIVTQLLLEKYNK